MPTSSEGRLVPPTIRPALDNGHPDLNLDPTVEMAPAPARVAAWPRRGRWPTVQAAEHVFTVARRRRVR